MAISEESKALLQAQVELWNQTFSFMKSVALAVALDLRIADAIHHPRFSLPVTKKPEVTDKHVYRIYRKILGFDVLFSDEISKKYLILYGE